MDEFGEYPFSDEWAKENLEKPKKVILWIGTWSSTCGACGKSADPKQKSHDIILGYGSMNGQPGCGATWTHVQSEYTGEEMANATKAMRPDLEFISWNRS